MTDLAYPRLDAEHVTLRVQVLDAVPLDQLRGHSSTQLAGHRFREVSEGGRVDEAALRRFQAGAREIMDSIGFPKALTRDSARLLDQRLAAALGELLPMTEAEAASNEVWSFLGLLVVPDLTYWRNPSSDQSSANLERRMGTPSRRMVLQRAWWKANTLGPEIAARMNEEETVAVMERSFSGFPPLAREFMREHFSRVDAGGDRGRQALVRAAAKLLVRRMVVINVFALNSAGLESFITGVFDDAEAITGRTLLRTAQSSASNRVAEPHNENVESLEGPTAHVVDPVVTFREAIGEDLWQYIKHAAVPLAFEGIFELQVALQAHPTDDAHDIDLSRRLQFDLLDLLDLCSELSDQETAVVAAASKYYLLAEDALPDRDQGGLRDDDLVVAAAYESLGRVRIYGS